jgi:CheY-specific phosphatase CheX
MGLDPAPLPPSPGAWRPGEEIIVMTGFTGDVQGILSLHSSPDLAFEMAAKRMGMAVHDFDSRVREMIEELGDAVANHLRAKLQNLGWRCSFSPPAVISGSEYHFHSTRRSQYVACAVTLGGKPLWLTLGLRRAPAKDDLLDRAT